MSKSRDNLAADNRPTCTHSRSGRRDGLAYLARHFDRNRPGCAVRTHLGPSESAQNPRRWSLRPRAGSAQNLLICRPSRWGIGRNSSTGCNLGEIFDGSVSSAMDRYVVSVLVGPKFLAQVVPVDPTAACRRASPTSFLLSLAGPNQVLVGSDEFLVGSERDSCCQRGTRRVPARNLSGRRGVDIHICPGRWRRPEHDGAVCLAISWLCSDLISQQPRSAPHAHSFICANGGTPPRDDM